MSRPLHILYIGTLPPHHGGSAISAQQLIRGFAARGHRVRAFSPMTEEALRSGDDFARRHPEIEVTRYTVPSFNYVGTVPASDSYRQLEAQRFHELLPGVLEARPDVVLIGREYLVEYAMPILKAHGLAVAIRPPGTALVGLVKGVYPAAQARQVINGLGQADRILALAAYQADWLRSLGLTRVQVIRNAVDVERFSPRSKDDSLQQALGIPDDHLVVLLAGNLNERKRPLDVVAAAEAVLVRRAAMTFVVLGDGPLREEMEALCRRSGILGHFRFIDWIDHDEVPRYMNLADLVVLPSEGEGMARVYLEAQASGRVLIASDIVAAQEVVEHGETGLLFRLGDAEDLAAQILRAAGDPELRRRIGLKARARIAPHAVERAVTEYLTAFEEIAPRAVNVRESGTIL